MKFGGPPKGGGGGPDPRDLLPRTTPVTLNMAFGSSTNQRVQLISGRSRGSVIVEGVKENSTSVLLNLLFTSNSNKPKVW